MCECDVTYVQICIIDRRRERWFDTNISKISSDVMVCAETHPDCCCCCCECSEEYRSVVLAIAVVQTRMSTRRHTVRTVRSCCTK